MQSGNVGSIPTGSTEERIVGSNPTHVIKDSSRIMVNRESTPHNVLEIGFESHCVPRMQSSNGRTPASI